MAFGIKAKTIKTANKYSLETFYEAIKDKNFTAGKPEYTKHAFGYVITFPALDSQNQVWITVGGFGKETNKFTIQKAQQAGVDNMVKNAALDHVTGGAFGLGGVVGSNTKECERLVDVTVSELSEMGL